MASVSFHFHGYQPGDLVRWLGRDPLDIPAFEERRSPVVHRIGEERIAGMNWTDAVLRTYRRMQSVLDRAAGAASVDIEPHTLVWLLERDRPAYDRILRAYEQGIIGFVMTPPFHPILPHHHKAERQALFDLMIDFYAPLLGRVAGGPVGLWLPEAAYSRETVDDYFDAARGAASVHEGLPDLAHYTHLLLDARQLAFLQTTAGAWARIIHESGTAAMARDPALSGDFAFGGSRAGEFVAKAMARAGSSVLIASDLESLLANPAQVERFETIVDSLREAGVAVGAPAAPSDLPSARAVDFSSWSDYDEFLHDGHTSDARWSGLRRADGVVISRIHRGQRMSQLWKHAFTIATTRVETAVRRTSKKILKSLGVRSPAETLRRLAVAYGRHVFQAHYRAHGFASRDVDFASNAETILRGKVDVVLAAHLTRGYVLMLMGLRSDPRFWDNPDTRVTFQNVALMTRSMMDAVRANEVAGNLERATDLRRLLRATLVDFSEWHARGEFADLSGAEGWETAEGAWHGSLQSEVPDRSGYDVVRRATFFALDETELQDLGISPRREEIVADTGHIAGEAHGDWANKAWCEHRSP